MSRPTVRVSRFDFARPREVPTGRVALAGTAFDAKPCLIGHFSLRRGKCVMDAAEATIAIRNPPPPGVIRHTTLRGASSDTVLFLDVFESTAAVANALLRLQSSPDAMLSLSAVVESGGEAWVGPVSCIPASIIPRSAVVRALTLGADAITIVPRDAALPPEAAAKSPLRDEEVFAPRYWRHASINWYTTAPFEAACSAAAHAYEVEPVRFEMETQRHVVAAAGGPAANDTVESGGGGRGYGTQRYTYQHRPHDAPVRRPTAVTPHAGHGSSEGAVWRLQDEADGVRAASAVLRTQGFRSLGVREARVRDEAGSVAAMEVFSDTATAGGRDDDSHETSDGPASGSPSAAPWGAAAPTTTTTSSSSPSVTIPPSDVSTSLLADSPQQQQQQHTATRKAKALPAMCAQVIEANGKRQRCYVDQRKVLAPEAGDFVVVAEPSTPPGSAAAAGGEVTVIGRVVAVSRWSRRKAGSNSHQGHPRLLRRATMAELAATLIPSAVQPVEVEAIPAVLNHLGDAAVPQRPPFLAGLYVVRVHPEAPSCLVVAVVAASVIGPAGPTAISAADLRAAVGKATGAPERSVFRVVDAA